MNHIVNYLKQPTWIIGWWSEIDIELPRWQKYYFM